MSEPILVPIAKGGANATISVDLSTLPDEMYALVMAEGLKAILNTRMSKVGAITKLEGVELEKANAEAMKIAAKNLSDLQEGALKKKGKASKSTLPREVQTEARRIAREVVKNEMRKAKIKPSMVAASEITKAADALIAADPSIIEKAQANLEQRSTITSVGDLLANIHVDPKKVAKAEKDKAEKAKTLSAKQSGFVAPRKKGAAPIHTTH